MISRKKLFVSKCLLERFKFRLALQIFNKVEIVHETFRVLFTALIKIELHLVLTVKLEINTLITRKATHSLAILVILFATRSLLASEFMMSLVPICNQQYPLSHPFHLKTQQQMPEFLMFGVNLL